MSYKKFTFGRRPWGPRTKNLPMTRCIAPISPDSVIWWKCTKYVYLNYYRNEYLNVSRELSKTVRQETISGNVVADKNVEVKGTRRNILSIFPVEFTNNWLEYFQTLLPHRFILMLEFPYDSILTPKNSYISKTPAPKSKFIRPRTQEIANQNIWICFSKE